MNTNEMCERCNEQPADTLIEGYFYAEMVCYGCRKDEDNAEALKSHAGDEDYWRWVERGE
jgi:hypothetical protein